MKITPSKLTFIICLALTLLPLTNLNAAPPDISDAVVADFIQNSFQFDYTTVTDDASLRKLVDAVDYQMVIINYRTILEKTALKTISPAGNKFEQQLDRRYLEILHDGYLFQIFSQWQNKTADPTSKAFIDLFLFDREQLLAYPAGMGRVGSLAKRISKRLQNFHFKIEDKYYGIDDMRRLISTSEQSDEDRRLARRLVKMRRDSSAILVPDAILLYKMYNAMGLEKGGLTWQEYLFLPYSLKYSDWINIAKEIKTTTDDIYFAGLNKVKKEHRLDQLTGWEFDNILNRQAVLPDSYFSRDRIDTAIVQLLENLGLRQLLDRLTILEVDDKASFAAAIYRYPPDDILFVKTARTGFAGYYRLLSELGKSLPWAYADTTRPFLLRTYAPGTSIMTSELLISLGTDPKFLAANFDIPEEKLKLYGESSKLLTMYQIRKMTQYILFDYNLSLGKTDDATKLFWDLEQSITGFCDSSYFWIDALVSGRIEDYPNLLAQAFGRLKMREILYHQIGPDYDQSTETGRFLIENFCAPGRGQELKEFIEAYSPDPLSIADLKRQME